MQLILPKNFVDVGRGSFYEKTPLFFLAGPVQGGGDWQRKMLSLIKSYEERCLVAVPCRYSQEDEIRGRHAPRCSQNVFERQTDWERYYLEHASRKGCIIFWLAEEDKINPRNDGDPYARDTYGELGEWRGRLMNNPNLRVVIGAEPGFPGLSVIKRNFESSLKFEFQIHSIMEATVVAAIQKSHNLA